MVFAVTSSMVKNTAVVTDTRIRPMLPTWSRNCLMNTRSVAVLVSFGEFANMRIDALRPSRRSASGLATLHHHPAHQVLAELQRLVEVVVVEHRAVACPSRVPSTA